LVKSSRSSGSMSRTAPDAISVVLLLIARLWQAERELAT
jgi:hypothetical protein